MPKVLSEARHICPELTPAIKAFDTLAYTRQYSDVFYDFIDWCLYQHMMPPSPTDENPLNKYKKKEQDLFMEAFQNIHSEIRKRVNLWAASDSKKYVSNGWYDPLGRLYECITSQYKSSAMGQYFTPEPVVNLMTQLTIKDERKGILRILDPACGSGRMGLGAATHLMSQKNGCWVTMNDLDSICTKMTAVNLAFHGLVGESICMNGLDIEGKSFRFAYRVSPAMAFIPQEQWGMYRMLIMAKTGQDPKKSYVIQEVPYEETFLKVANDNLIAEYQERVKNAQEEEKRQAMEDLKAKVQKRMSGTLFADNEIIIDDLQFPSEKEIVKKTKSPKKKGDDNGGNSQGSLF